MRSSVFSSYDHRGHRGIKWSYVCPKTKIIFLALSFHIKQMSQWYFLIVILKGEIHVTKYISILYACMIIYNVDHLFNEIWVISLFILLYTKIIFLPLLVWENKDWFTVLILPARRVCWSLILHWPFSERSIVLESVWGGGLIPKNLNKKRYT